jgi:hypothetical protein
LIIEYENVVVGSCLNAALFAFNNNLPIFFAECRRPFRFDYIDASTDLSCLKIPGAAKTLTTFEGKKKVGVPKEILWERLLFLLALNGKMPLANRCNNMRYDGSILTCSTEYSKLIDVRFESCFYFGDRHCDKLVDFAAETDDFTIYDWIAFNRGGKHDIDYIHTDDKFVSDIWYYSSDRIDGATPVKDACAVSTLNTKELENFDYSETMARFKTVFEMEARGMKGPLSSVGPNGKPKHYKFRTSIIKREKVPFESLPVSIATNIKTPSVSEEQQLVELATACAPYNSMLRHL